MKTILLTGGSKGIGLAVAEHLLKNHTANVVSVSRSRTEAVEKLEKEYHGQYQHLVGDVTKADLAQKAVHAAISAFGSLDGLICNAGIIEPISRLSPSTGANGLSEAESDKIIADWDHLFQVNIFSIVRMLQQAVPHLRKSKGKVILVSSGAARKSYVSWGAYGASKAALNHLNQTLSVEEPEIVSMAIAPGVVATDMQGLIRSTGQPHMSAEEFSKFTTLHQSGGLLPPERPAGVIASLILNAQKSLSGTFFEWDSDEAKKYMHTEICDRCEEQAKRS